MSNPDFGCYYIDTQFGTLSYQKEISGVLPQEPMRGGCFFIVQVLDDEKKKD